MANQKRSERTQKGSANTNIHEMIERKAFELYNNRGAKPGKELDDWLEAEKLVTQRSS
ncbi:MAG: DUF2934 domain-containing protein [Candidatus Omnitrophica bacterium]|nr:DUF2934 domain-containing protein [Candidatus Omnitrophota bacterium]MDD5552252.1 DUF2934 domain-containing protein [Candidatus Omnitrophota bacterium]